MYPFSCCGMWIEYLVWLLLGKNVGKKRGFSVTIECDLSAKEKDMKKYEIRKNAITKRNKSSNQAENDHC